MIETFRLDLTRSTELKITFFADALYLYEKVFFRKHRFDFNFGSVGGRSLFRKRRSAKLLRSAGARQSRTAKLPVGRSVKKGDGGKQTCLILSTVIN